MYEYFEKIGLRVHPSDTQLAITCPPNQVLTIRGRSYPTTDFQKKSVKNGRFAQTLTSGSTFHAHCRVQEGLDSPERAFRDILGDRSRQGDQ